MICSTIFGQQNSPSKASSTDTITLGGGCYWCVEAIYENLNGVISVTSGFSGGKTINPTYKQVCTGETGHAECVQITYDKTITNLSQILKIFFTVHDPTSLNRQGADEGTQYRSVIFYKNDEQKKIAQTIINSLNKEHVYNSPIVTTLEPYNTFYKAENYHQNYYENNKTNLIVKWLFNPS